MRFLSLLPYFVGWINQKNEKQDYVYLAKLCGYNIDRRTVVFFFFIICIIYSKVTFLRILRCQVFSGHSRSCLLSLFSLFFKSGNDRRDLVRYMSSVVNSRHLPSFIDKTDTPSLKYISPLYRNSTRCNNYNKFLAKEGCKIDLSTYCAGENEILY